MSVVRELAEYRGDPAVSTVYLDVDGRHRPTTASCTTALEILADRLRASVNGDVRVERSVRDDVGRMQAWLHDELDRHTTRGVALFSCADQDWFRAVPLARSVRDEAVVGPTPRLGQLIEQLQLPDSLLIALVDRRRLRIVAVERDRVIDVASLDEPAPRTVDSAMETGGFDGYLDELFRTHVRHAASAVQAALEARPAERLALAGTDEAVAALTAHLPVGARQRLVDRLPLAVDATDAHLVDATRTMLDELTRRREHDAVEELVQRAGARDRAVIGIRATLAAIGAKRVGRLMVSSGLRMPGTECTGCGHLDVEVDRCWRCGAAVTRVDDVIEVALDRAVGQRADVEIHRTDALAAVDGIGAIERF